MRKATADDHSQEPGADGAQAAPDGRGGARRALPSIVNAYQGDPHE
jgi:hypothetical protein